MSGEWGEGPTQGEDASSGAVSTGGGGAVPPPRTGGRAEARRAAQGKGGDRSGSGSGPTDGDKGGDKDGRAGGRAAARRGGKPKKNVKKIVAWSAAGVLVLIAGAGGAIYLKLNANIKSFDADAIATDRPPEAKADADGNKPVNLLLIGSDSRGKNNADLGGGEDGGARSDTTILLHVYADHKHAVGISIPRNAKVPIPSCKLPNGKWTKGGGVDLFNSAFSLGGSDDGNPACTQNTVEKITGIRVDHTIVIDFNGFASMTKAIGGVDVCLPKPIYEGDINPKLTKKGALVLPQGKQTVEGQKALDYVRLRHGIGDGSDIGRMKRQQAFLSSFASKAKKDGLSPTNLLPLADAATKSLTVDPGLDSADKLISFGMSLRNIDMHELKFVTAPWRYRTQDQDLDLVHPDAEKLWETLKADQTVDGQNATGQQPDAPATNAPAPQPTTPAAPAADTANASIKVAVYNGTMNNGLAGKATELLKGAKFTATTAGQGPNTKYKTTVVEYGSGQKANADKVAALFPGATVSSGGGRGVNVIVGQDFAAASGMAGASGGAATPAPGAPAGAPQPLPTSVTNDVRSADDDICANTSYGSGG
ncbi:LCP family protein [Streptomyces sp. NRRL WC-3742]|uniref:LCP family protein n=1 Tax=Streptomyces sp. NRRL WC-3742 TaxID=1463934 RepID=UPI00099E15C2|nr:LCP family protein [Streptomyces sp. NRRL WC-3742]